MGIVGAVVLVILAGIGLTTYSMKKKQQAQPDVAVIPLRGFVPGGRREDIHSGHIDDPASDRGYDDRRYDDRGYDDRDREYNDKHYDDGDRRDYEDRDRDRDDRTREKEEQG